MIEMLLVVAIIMLTTLVAAPSFVRSFRGARLRTSARSVVMVHRHARSVAILQQKQTAVFYDSAQGRLELAIITDPRKQSAQARFLDQGGLPTEEEGASAIESELVRYLAANIRIEDVQVSKGGQEFDGIHWVSYYPNGMCDDFSLRLVDEKGRWVEIDADPYSGSIEIEESRS
jgi:type II secretory pathway pseudopilin PulG